jgi:transposase-like protein
MTRNRKITLDQIADAIVALYLETGHDPDAPTIATRAGCSVGTVRRLARDHSFPGCLPRTEWRQSYSRDYPGFEAGAHKVTVYGPTRETLRQLVLAKSAQEEK